MCVSATLQVGWPCFRDVKDPAKLQSWLEGKQQKVFIEGPVVGYLIVSDWTEKAFLESQHLVQWLVDLQC